MPRACSDSRQDFHAGNGLFSQITLAIYPSLYYLLFIIPLGPKNIARKRTVPAQSSLFWGGKRAL